MRTLLFWLLFLPNLCFAQVIAVLPLDRGVGSAEYDGLGRALSGMLVTDFSTAGLDLVERGRIDAILAELELNQTDFIDPKAAMKLGKGIGADVLALGTWSVVDATFLMDVRLIDAETGEVLKAAKSDGPVADFIGVEKVVLEGLLEGLEVALAPGARRKLMLESPTEVFDALAKYAEGQQRELEGRIEEARKAYGAAVKVDPQFAAAQAALSGLSESIAEARASDLAAVQSALGKASRSVLDATVDERTRKNGFTHTSETTGAFLMRTVALQNLGLECQRVEEMRAYLDHVNWAVVKDYKAVKAAYALAEQHGISRGKAEGPPVTRAYSLGDRLEIGEGLPAFLLHESKWWSPGAGLYDSIRTCFPPEAALEALDALAAEIGSRGLGDDALGQLPLRDDLELAWAYHRAGTLGASAELNQRLAAVLDRHPEGSASRELVLSRQEHQILPRAEAWRVNRLSRGGLSTERILEVSRQVAAGGEGLKLDTAACQAAQKDAFRLAGNQVAFYEEYLPKGVVQDSALNTLAAFVLILRDFGCTGESARFDGVEQVVGWLGAAKRRAGSETDPRCVGYFTTFDGSQKTDALGSYLAGEKNGMSQAPWLLRHYYLAAGAGCVDVSW